ncbi:MAG: SIMPL domain-containing protein [Paludibacteraceae bacterium]|nr:SIMPL domain-containing protein [Paludibacteraceae bacterium]
MKDFIKYGIIGISCIVCAIVLGNAITYVFKSQHTISVTGLGEENFTSDLIIWTSTISVESNNQQQGYAVLEQAQKKVAAFLTKKGIPQEAVKFNFVNVSKRYESIYNDNGNWVGQRMVGYQLQQEFTIESNDVSTVEQVSREISSLIAEGVNLDIMQPQYYCTNLDSIKLQLIEKASSDAYQRAQKIAENAGAKLGKANNVKLGVFQITSATGEEEYSYGGTFNTSSKDKKGRITVRAEYLIK